MNLEEQANKSLYTDEELAGERLHVVAEMRENPENIALLETFIADLERSKVNGFITEKQQLNQLDEFLVDMLVLAKNIHHDILEKRVRELKDKYFPEEKASVA